MSARANAGDGLLGDFVSQHRRQSVRRDCHQTDTRREVDRVLAQAFFRSTTGEGKILPGGSSIFDRARYRKRPALPSTDPAFALIVAMIGRGTVKDQKHGPAIV